MDAAGHLFGTTNGETGGIPGTFFKLAFTGTGWMETVLHSFSGADGIGPSSSPLMDAAGNFYGTTYQGGNSNNAGVVFSLAPAGATTLSVSLLGPGTVTSSPSGINCPATCSASFTAGTQVGLSQTPAGGWSFGGWGGACSGIAGCTVTMTSNQSVAAAFWTNGSVVPYPSPAGAPQVSGVPSPPPAAP